MSQEWPEILTPLQVAEYLQIELNDVISLLSSGEMPGNKIVGKWRIRKTKLDEWIDSEVDVIEQSDEWVDSEVDVIEQSDEWIDSEVDVIEQSDTGTVSTERLIEYEIEMDPIILDEIQINTPLNNTEDLTKINTENLAEPKIIIEVKQSHIENQLSLVNKVETLLNPPKRDMSNFLIEKSERRTKANSLTNNSSRRQVLFYKAEKLYQEALAAKEQNNIKKARELFEEAITVNPSLNIFQAYAAMEEKNFRIENALKVLKKGIQEFPEEGALYDNYGMLLRRRKDIDGAAKILKEGIEKAPNSKQLHWSLARVLVDIDNDISLQEAVVHAERAKELGMPLQDDPYYKKLRLVNGPEIGRKAFNFFRISGFDIKIRTFTDKYVDIFITTEQVEYTESYDLNGWLLARCFFQNILKRNDVDNLIAFLRKEKDLNSDICFLILNDSSSLRDTLYRIMEDSREAIVPIDNNIFNQLDSKGEDVTGILRQVLDQWLSRRDLFHNRFPVSGRRFFGRESELQNIMRNIDDGQHIGIYGLRKVGKTSLLYQLKEKRPQDLVIYIDLQEISGSGINDCAYLYWAISRRLHEVIVGKGSLHLAEFKLKLGSKSSYSVLDKPEKRNAPYFIEDINRLLNLLSNNEETTSSKIVITIDELEYMLPIPGYSGGFNGYADFFANLRGIAQRTQGKLVSVITAANPLVSEQTTWEKRDNPVFQFYRDTFLPPLAKQECYEMIEKLGRGMGIYFDTDSLNLVYAETGGHPYITRQLCSHLIHQDKTRPLQVSSSLVIQNIETFIRDKGAIFGEILDRLENYFPQELDLLLFIAEGLSEESELSSLVTIPIDVALRHLIGYQIVDYQDSKYKIKINLLHRWLKRYRLGT